MSNDPLDQAEETVSRLTGTSGSQVSTAPSVGKKAHPMDPDRPVWERQPNESKKAYDTFLAWRDSDERNVTRHGRTAKQWSAEWSWGYRAFEHDLYVQRRVAEELIRYRLDMNDRQRKIAYAAQMKLIEWLRRLDVDRLRPGDAARWLEIAVKIERMAAGANTEQVGVVHSGTVGLQVENMSAEEVDEALKSLATEIETMSGR
jgi:hypothetical protein